jgi:hypothetical protein
MQEKYAKIWKEKSYAKYAEVHFFFAFLACICTPHLADVQVEDTDDIHWRASLGTVTAGRARARGLLLVAWSLPVTRRVGL